MSRQVEYSFQGKAQDGDLLVVDGALPNLRTESLPSFLQVFPKYPRLEKGQRAVLVYDGKEVKWHTRDKGVSGGQSAGISLVMIIAVVIAYDKFKKWQESDD